METKKTILSNSRKTAENRFFLFLVYYLVMYYITIGTLIKRGSEMDKGKLMTKIKKMPVEEKYKLLSATDKAYIRGFLDRSIVELMRKGDGETEAPPPKRSSGKNK